MSSFGSCWTPIVLIYSTCQITRSTKADRRQANNFLEREGILMFCGFIVKRMVRGFGNAKGFYNLWLYSKENGKEV